MLMSVTRIIYHKAEIQETSYPFMMPIKCILIYHRLRMIQFLCTYPASMTIVTYVAYSWCRCWSVKQGPTDTADTAKYRRRPQETATARNSIRIHVSRASAIPSVVDDL